MSILPEDRAPGFDGHEALPDDPRGDARINQRKGARGRFPLGDFEPAGPWDATNDRRQRRGVMVMSDPQQKAAELRRHAALCVAIAERMSLREHRDRMMDMAKRFLELAQKADANPE
ncbi:MAG TPA: hypothetical protein VFU97_08100 [Xanthobacteraceae bacterium]|jgi:hypothetical protein|nr:hypothetical protein [Xanthobacteraceae bacterium]